MRQNYSIFIGVAGFLSLTNYSYADCTSPAAIAATVEYNTTDSRFEYCNGSDWIALAGTNLTSSRTQINSEFRVYDSSYAVDIDSLNSSNGSSNAWNQHGLRYRAANNAISFLLSGQSNDRKAAIQAGHENINYSQHLSSLALNPFGGKVGINMLVPSVALDVNGDIEYTGSINDVSDRRLKTSIETLPTALNSINALKPVSFKMKNNLDDIELGFIAQEVMNVFPNLVRTSSDPSQTLSLNYTGLIAPLVKSVQELTEKNSALEKRLLLLEND